MLKLSTVVKLFLYLDSLEKVKRPKAKRRTVIVPPKMTNSDSGWERLPNSGELAFEDYSHVDDNISVHGALTDDDIFNLAHLDEEEDEEEQSPIPVTLSEARGSLTILRFYALRTETSDNFFQLSLLSKIH
ncbi:hypothetical protein LAZ67_21000825 [Cordylochernes scorpioides]|uniref:Uncharacterized protein n=1 Tax=Cordylochernes scorpioides TaxID=51811 RepID=A0ABY6LLQ5_9ARAC|nr:hypothetical protein LAZ67_21000825 [Cordylochernes scorpioides]